MVKRRNIMRKILMLISVVLLFSSCVEHFDKSKYKGWKFENQIIETFTYMDIVVLSNDELVTEVDVPTWFKDIYQIGDTIK